MHRMRRRLVASMLGLSVLVGSVAIASVLARPDDVTGRTFRPFRVSGTVKGLYPGRVKTLRVRVRNPNGVPMRVRFVRVRVVSPVSTCPARSVRVKPWRGSVQIRAGASKRLRLQVRMRRWTPDACQGVRYRLRYKGWAVTR